MVMIECEIRWYMKIIKYFTGGGYKPYWKSNSANCSLKSSKRLYYIGVNTSKPTLRYLFFELEEDQPDRDDDPNGAWRLEPNDQTLRLEDTTAGFPHSDAAIYSMRPKEVER